MRKSALCQVASLFLAIAPAWAGSIDLAWNPVPGASGYRIHYGTSSGDYDHVRDVGNVTSASLEGLADCTEYFVAVKAYNGAGESPDFSNEVTGWAHPDFEPVIGTAVQGSQIVLDIDGANFDVAGEVELDTSAVPLDSDGEPLVRFDATTILDCNRLQTLITVEPTAAGVQAMQIGDLPIGVRVVNPDGVHGESMVTFTVAFNLSRADLNRDDQRTQDRVDGADLATLAQAWATSLGDSEFEFDSDLDGDTDIDGEDLSLLAAQFGQCRDGSSWSAEACL